MNEQDSHEIRDLRWRNKQLGKQLGKTGQKIHELRCALAECREINGKIARDYVRDLEREVARNIERIVALEEVVAKLYDRNGELLEKLQAPEKPVEIDTRPRVGQGGGVK